MMKRERVYCLAIVRFRTFLLPMAFFPNPAFARDVTLAWEATRLLNEVWHEKPKYPERYHLFRLVAHLAKYFDRYRPGAPRPDPPAEDDPRADRAAAMRAMADRDEDRLAENDRKWREEQAAIKSGTPAPEIPRAILKSVDRKGKAR